MNRVTQLHRTCCGVAFACCVFLSVGQSDGTAQTVERRPTLEQVCRITTVQLAKRENYQSGDLITQSDVKGVLKALAGAGWQPADGKKIIALALPDDDPLVKILGTKRGERFMRQSAGADLIYDRLDRVCRVSGGQRMITDLAKLPNGHKFAQLDRPHGVPGFLDLLPKTASGMRRSIKEYRKPTGRIYTEKQLLQRLKESYRGKVDTASAR